MAPEKSFLMITFVSIFLLTLFSCIEESTDPNTPPLKNSENLYIYSLNADRATFDRTESLDFSYDIFDVILKVEDYSKGSGTIQIYSGDTLIFEQALDSNKVVEIANISGYIPTSVSIKLTEYTGNISLVISGHSEQEIPANSPAIVQDENIFVYTLHAVEFSVKKEYTLDFTEDSLEVILSVSNHSSGNGEIIILDGNNDSLFIAALDTDKVVSWIDPSGHIANKCAITTANLSADLSLIVRTKGTTLPPPIIVNSPMETNEQDLYIYTIHAENCTVDKEKVLYFTTDSVRIGLQVNNYLSGDAAISIETDDHSTLFSYQTGALSLLDSMLNFTDIPGVIAIRLTDFSGDLSFILRGYEKPAESVLHIINSRNNLNINMTQSVHFSYLDTSLVLYFETDTLRREVEVINYSSGYAIITILDSSHSKVFEVDTVYSNFHDIDNTITNNGNVPLKARVQFDDFSGTFSYCLQERE
jgi:hypothetical protein